MKISNTSVRLKEAMALRGLKQTDIVEKTGINKGALSSYISGRYEPKQDNIYSLATLLNVNEAWLMGYDVPMIRESKDKHIENKTLFPDEFLIIEKYRLLDGYGKKVVNNILDMEFDRSTTQKSRILRQIPLADFPLSAGSGNLLLDNTYEMIEVDGNEYPDANIAFKVKGNSMEPKYKDGDIVYIHKQEQINIGEIGAFLVDDMQYIKQLKKDNEGYYLHSLNPQYDNIRIVGNIICYGRVIN